jgi:hypothetical protein
VAVKESVVGLAPIAGGAVTVNDAGMVTELAPVAVRVTALL